MIKGIWPLGFFIFILLKEEVISGQFHGLLKKKVNIIGNILQRYVYS